MYRGEMSSEFSGDEINENAVLSSCSGVKNNQK